MKLSSLTSVCQALLLLSSIAGAPVNTPNTFSSSPHGPAALDNTNESLSLAERSTPQLPLFHGGLTGVVKGNDVIQRESKNCWLLATIKLLAELHPTAISNLFTVFPHDPTAVIVTLPGEEPQTIHYADMRMPDSPIASYRPNGPWWPGALMLALERDYHVDGIWAGFATVALDMLTGLTLSPIMPRKHAFDTAELASILFPGGKSVITLLGTGTPTGGIRWEPGLFNANDPFLAKPHTYGVLDSSDTEVALLNTWEQLESQAKTYTYSQLAGKIGHIIQVPISKLPRKSARLATSFKRPDQVESKPPPPDWPPMSPTEMSPTPEPEEMSPAPDDDTEMSLQ